jgi:hypothetical protein
LALPSEEQSRVVTSSPCFVSDSAQRQIFVVSEKKHSNVGGFEHSQVPALGQLEPAQQRVPGAVAFEHSTSFGDDVVAVHEQPSLVDEHDVVRLAVLLPGPPLDDDAPLSLLQATIAAVRRRAEVARRRMRRIARG